MKIHVKIYLKEHGLTIADIILCEVCSKVAVDIHHIEAKGMGGSKTKDHPANLIALCRECHIKAHNHTLSKEFLKQKKHEKETY